MNKSPIPIQRSRLYPAVIITLILAVIGITAWTATSSPAMSLSSTSTPTHAPFFAIANIVKPTYTPSPTALATSSSVETEIPSNTSESIISAKIVDTSASDYAAPVIQNNDTSQIAAPGYGGNKYILVDISEQHMYVYEGDTVVYSFVSSTGMHNATRVGTFSVLDKIPSAYGATWNIWMPNWLGIYYSGSLENGIHALPILPNGATLWAGYLGIPISYGCVVLGTYEAQLLYDWVDVGTPVEIQW